MSTVQAVVFDIGNVLVGWQPEAFFDASIGEARRKQLFAQVDLHSMNLAVDRGAPFAQSVQDLANAHPEWAPEILLWRSGWSRMFAPVIAPNVSLMRRLRAVGMPVFALSNFGKETFEIACQTHDFLTEFDREFISGHLGVLKPEPEIYEIVERDTGIPPSGLFFIDDRQDNIEAAIARGWNGHVFQTHDALLQDLQRHGVDLGQTA